MEDTTVRLSVTLDRKTLAEAMRLTRARTKRQTIAKALDELVKAERRRSLAGALGTGVFETTEDDLRQRRHRSHERS
ncbi:MAG: type II toxin-antitoxin system VapB family antitoxin [Deinococcus sp.]|nr:type II toxin-antitoxin system VapB family antitoxin [Deinococcus sp.]